MIGEGRHMVNVIAWGLIESQSANNPEQFAVECEATDGSGERITWFGTFGERAFPYTMEKIRAFGLVGTDLTALKRATDAPVPIVVKAEEYQGKMQMKVAFVGDRKGIGKALDPAAARSFAQQMKSQMAAWDAENGVAPATNARTAATRPAAPSNGRGFGGGGSRQAPPQDDDGSDIPF